MGEGWVARLGKWGCDTDGAMERMLDDESFYRDCLDTFLNDDHFARLGRMLNENNVREAFLSAHALKGVSANLGLTPLYKAICELVEPLRAGDMQGVMPIYVEMESQRAMLKAILESAQI